MPDLGKYATEVLGAYGVTLMLMAGLVVFTLRRGKRARAALKEIEQETVRNAKG